MTNPDHIGGRRVERPRTVETCPSCALPHGAGYAECADCRAFVDAFWLADWQALLEREGITPGGAEERELARRVTDAGTEGEDAPPWTVRDWAMSLLTCAECGGELGERYATCGECGLAFGPSIIAEYEATANEHAVHIGRWVLRYPQHHSANSVAAWKLTYPRVLTGWLPTTAEAQAAMQRIKAGDLASIQAEMRAVDAEIAARAKGAEPTKKRKK